MTKKATGIVPAKASVPTKDTSMVIKAVDQKPHSMYIKYLISRKWSPARIRQNLINLGLSSPTEDIIERYYEISVKPLIRLCKLPHVFQDYDNALASERHKKGRRFPPEIKFRLTFGDDPDEQFRFIQFIKMLEVDFIWQTELVTFYGKKENVPTDPDTGLCAIESFTPTGHIPLSILTSPHRAIFDEQMLEGVTSRRIAEYMRKNFNMDLDEKSIELYRQAFFGVQMHDTKSKLMVLRAERENLVLEIKNIESKLSRVDLDVSGYTEGDATSLIKTKKDLVRRVSELDTNIGYLNADFTEAANAQKRSITKSKEDMATEMMNQLFSKFSMMAQHNDRDVIDPLTKLVKGFGISLDNIERAKQMDSKAMGGGQSALIALIAERERSAHEERMKLLAELDEHANHIYTGVGEEDIDVTTIGGVDELKKKIADGEDETNE